MTRQATDRLARSRSQRLLAAGIRVRGQWRYLVRTSSDPFTLGDDGTRDAQRDERKPSGRHRTSIQEPVQ
jgi:hypothetical protein